MSDQTPNPVQVSFAVLPSGSAGGHTLMGRATVMAIAAELGDAIALPVLPYTPTRPTPDFPARRFVQLVSASLPSGVTAATLVTTTLFINPVPVLSSVCKEKRSVSHAGCARRSHKSAPGGD